MKIVLDDKDKSFIDKINQDISSGENIPLFVNQKKDYSISFKVKDIAKANAFIFGIIMNPDSERIKEIEELIGIRFTSINYSQGDFKLHQLKEKLRMFLDELEKL